MSEQKKYLFIGGQKDGEWIGVSDDQMSVNFPAWDELYASGPSEEGKDSTLKMVTYQRQEYCTLNGSVTYFLHQDTDMLDAFNALLLAYGEQAKAKKEKKRRKSDNQFSDSAEDNLRKAVRGMIVGALIESLAGDKNVTGIALVEVAKPIAPVDVKMIKAKVESDCRGAKPVIKFTSEEIYLQSLANCGLKASDEPTELFGVDLIKDGF